MTSTLPMTVEPGCILPMPSMWQEHKQCSADSDCGREATNVIAVGDKTFAPICRSCALRVFAEKRDEPFLVVVKDVINGDESEWIGGVESFIEANGFEGVDLLEIREMQRGESVHIGGGATPWFEIARVN